MLTFDFIIQKTCCFVNSFMNFFQKMFILKSAELIPQQINFVNPLFTYFFIYFFKMFYIFLKKALTQRLKCAIIPKSEAVPQNKNLGVAQLVARYLGVVEAASSSLVTQTSSEVHNEPPNFLYFTGFFGLFGDCTASKTSAIFLPKIGSKSGTTTCLTTFVTKKLYSIRLFGTL